MNKYRIILLLALGVPALAAAEEENMTLQQERDQIGAQMEESRRQGGRDLNAIRDPDDTGQAPADAAQSGASAPGARTGNNGPLINRGPLNGTGTSVNPGNQNDNSPITTTTPGISTTEPGRPTTTGTPTSPNAGSNGAEGNAASGNRGPTGGNGTSGGNGEAAAGGR